MLVPPEAKKLLIESVTEEENLRRLIDEDEPQDLARFLLVSRLDKKKKTLTMSFSWPCTGGQRCRGLIGVFGQGILGFVSPGFEEAISSTCKAWRESLDGPPGKRLDCLSWFSDIARALLEEVPELRDVLDICRVHGYR